MLHNLEKGSRLALAYLVCSPLKLSLIHVHQISSWKESWAGIWNNINLLSFYLIWMAALKSLFRPKSNLWVRRKWELQFSELLWTEEYCQYLCSADLSSLKFAQMFLLVSEHSHWCHSLPVLNMCELCHSVLVPKNSLKVLCGHESVLLPNCLAVPCTPPGISAGFSINMAVLASLDREGPVHVSMYTSDSPLSIESYHEDGFRLTCKRQWRLLQ